MRLVFIAISFSMFGPMIAYSQHTTYLTGDFSSWEYQSSRNKIFRPEHFTFVVDVTRLYTVGGIEIGPRLIADVGFNRRFFPLYGSGSLFMVGQKPFAISFDPSLEFIVRADVGYTAQEDALPTLVQSPLSSVLDGSSASGSIGFQKLLDNRLLLFAFLGYRFMDSGTGLSGHYVMHQTRGLEFSIGFGWRAKQ